MARLLDNFYILKTESGIKLTYVRSVPGEGDLYGERNPENGKDVCNLRRAKSAFLDLGQCNQWQYMGTFTAAADDPEKDIRRFAKWLKDWNRNHDSKIKYLLLFELGEKGRRLHAHTLLKDVPPDFVREYTKAEYSALPRDVKSSMPSIRQILEHVWRVALGGSVVGLRLFLVTVRRKWLVI